MPDEQQEVIETPLEAVERKRRERKAALKEQYDAQRAIDLAALDGAEVEHGDANVTAVDVPFEPGRVTLAIVKCPREAVLKRFRARTQEDQKANAIPASEEVADTSGIVLYPTGAELAALYAARPALKVQLGAAAMSLTAGKAQAEGKG